MFTTLKNWLESHSLRSDAGIARRERRVTRRLGRDILKGMAVGEKIDMGFTSGNKDTILKAFTLYRAVVGSEVKDLRAYIVGYKVLMRRAIESIELLEQDIKMNAHEQHKDELLRILAQMEAEILASFRGFLQGLTSFESANYSTTKLLDKASQARDLYYQALELRGPVKSLSRWIGREESSERSGQARDIVVERKAYENALNALRAELQRHTQGLHDAFIILQETAADAKVKLDLVQDEVAKERYPAAWADENRKEIAPVRTMIDDLVQDEIRQSRVLLSEIERAQG